MFKLACKDIDPSSPCGYVSTGETAEEAVEDMMTHAKADHMDKVTGMSDDDMRAMMMGKVHQ